MIRICRWPEERAAIAAAWRAIEASHATAPAHYRRFDWFESTARLSPPGSGQIAAIVVGRPDRPDAILGVRQSVGRLGIPRRLELLRDDHSVADWLIAHGADPLRTVADLVQGLRARGRVGWDVLVLSKLPADSGLLAGLRGLEDSGVVIAWTDHLHLIELPENPELLTAHLSRKFRRNLRAGWRQLAALGGGTAVRTVGCDSPEFEGVLRRVAELESAGWKGRPGGEGILTRPGGWERFADRARTLAISGAARLHLLAADRRLVAGQFCALEGDTLYFFRTAYDEAFADASPGHLLLQAVAEQVLRDGVRRIDCQSSATWLLPWRPVPALLATAWVFRNRVAGRVAGWAHQVGGRFRAGEGCPCGAGRLAGSRPDPGRARLHSDDRDA
jgi:CelD/BcsL family acetyltransferase involved in cellulose biosynthesis